MPPLELPPLPADLHAAARAVFGASVLPPGANPGLVWNRYPRVWERGPGGAPALPQNKERQGFLSQFAADFARSEARLAPALRGTHRRLARLAEGRSFVTYEPLVTGLGQDHPSENGFAFDPLLGVPFLPGSGLAGLARATAHILGEPEAEICALLGSEAPAGGVRGEATLPGRIVFLGGWPEVRPWPTLEVALISPHHPDYQRDQAQRTDRRRGLLPRYTEEPKPVAFLALTPNTPLTLYLAPRADASAADLERVWRWLAVGLNMLGFGGKTASGFGRMRMPSDPNPLPTTVTPPAIQALDLHAVADLLINLGFDERRDLWLAGLPRGFLASLPARSSRADQLRSDLHRLAEVSELTGLEGTPLAHALQTAARLLRSEHRTEAGQVEAWARQAAGGAEASMSSPALDPPAPSGPALGIILTAPIGGRGVLIADPDLCERAPVRKPVLRCFGNRPHLPDMHTNWNRLDALLKRDVQQVQKRMRADPELRSVAIAALAPMPLLIALGYHLGDAIQGEALLKLRGQLWGWQPAAPDDAPLSLRSPAEPATEGPVALLINLSEKNEPKGLPTDMAGARCWEITVPEPGPSAIRSRAQRNQFITLAQQAFGQMSAAGRGQPVHIFPAMAAALAVELGRLYLPKAWPPLKLWDYDRAGSTWRGPLDLG